MANVIGILMCGTKNDRSPVHLGGPISPMAVAAYTYETDFPPAEQQALPNEGHIVAALEWAEPDANAEVGSRD